MNWKTHKYVRIIFHLILCLMLGAGSACYMSAPIQAVEKTAADNDTPASARSHAGGSESYDIILLLDNSESMWGQQEERNRGARTVCKLAKTGNSRIGAVYFGQKLYGEPMPLKEDVEELAVNYLYNTEQDPDIQDTDISLALEEAVRLLKEDEKALTRKKAVILFSDGRNSNPADDEDTKKWAQVLHDMGAEIYCVYLERKRASNQDFLRKITNYFEEGSNLDKERFISVSENEMDALFDAFVKTFYNLQGDVRYRELSLNNEEVTVTVPSLGISTLQIALQTGGQAALTYKKTGESVSPEQDGENLYFLIENPNPGDYILKVEGDEAKGFMAYYSDLRADISVLNTDGSGDIAKGQDCRITADFYNPDGTKAMLVEGTEVHLVLDGSDFGAMTEEKGTWYSDEMVIRDFGSFLPAVEVHYGDFINLNFQGESIDVSSKAPVAKSLDDVFESSEDSEGHEVFSVRKSDLFINPERGEAVNIVSYEDLGTESQLIGFEEKDDYIVFTVSKPGRIHILMELEDEEGLASENKVEITGKVRNKAREDEIKRKFIIAAAVGLFILAVILLINYLKRKNAGETEEKLRDDFDALQTNLQNKRESMESVYDKFEDEVSADRELRRRLQSKLREVHEKERTLTENQRKSMGFDRYSGRSLEDLCPGLLDLDTIKKEAGSIEQIKKDCDELKNLQRASSADTLKGQISDLTKKQNDVDTLKETIDENKEKVAQENTRLRDACNDVETVLDKYRKQASLPIRFSLSIEGSIATGTQSCLKKGKYITGSYPLDNVEMFYYDNRPVDENDLPITLEKVLGFSTGIAVLPYEEDVSGGKKKEGLQLVSEKTFGFLEEGDTDGPKLTTGGILLAGHVYTIEVGKKNEALVITVEKEESRNGSN